MTTLEQAPFKKIITRSYTDVTVSEEGIHTEEFLEATDGLISMFDLFGSNAFLVVKNDLSNNVKKIRTRYTDNPSEFNTLELLMEKEAHLKKRPATEAVLWLKRGLNFTATSLLHSLNNPDQELSVSFNLAYDATLRPYHSFIVKPIFNLAMNACPYRKDFYANIGIETEEAKNAMKEWLEALIHLIHHLDTVFEQNPSYLKH